MALTGSFTSHFLPNRATHQALPLYGPSQGTLVVIGGGDDRGTGIMETFINRAGGLGAKIVVVPTADGNKTEDGQIKVYKEEDVVGSWKGGLGLENVRMLHTYDPKIADTEEFVKILREADDVWFNGGRQWHIVDSFKNILTEREFHKVLARGSVIGGSSAGATSRAERAKRKINFSSGVPAKAVRTHRRRLFMAITCIPAWTTVWLAPSTQKPAR